MQRHRYSLFGHALISGEDFSHSLQSANSECHPALEFIVKRRQTPPDLQEFEQIFPTGNLSSHRSASLFIYRGQNIMRIEYTDFALYDVYQDKVVCYPSAQTGNKQLHLNFLGPIMSLWLEQQGYLVLHASAVLIDNKAVLFLAESQQGKSTLAAAMVKMAYPLLSDDLLAVKYSQAEDRFYAYPSYPVIKLWPDQFKRLFANQSAASFLDEDLKKCRARIDHINPELFCTRPYQLASMYKLCRRGTSKKIVIKPISRVESVTALIRFSFAAPIMIAAGWQPRRLSEFSRLSSHVPVHNLIYPSEIESLDSVCNQIINNFSLLT